ncbi:hypothetical protein chiPu_0012892 [Chiloscyllium punctatum]|uniref:Kinesin motor domain-containing protein n=1 Tax=Chiloscyllium punctatum TaxID=137246 RepID=A0A401SVI9_CHIPU|nr:hypothetical protein [Chiloscyllium punctatum]
MLSADSVQVAVRVRPFNQMEKDAGSCCIISMVLNSITVCHPRNRNNTKTFLFDLSYWSHNGFIKNKEGILIPDGPASKYADQKRVFDDLGQEMLNNAWKGYNATLLAYGQTGSGKSYSMIGYGPDRGIIPLTCDGMFKIIHQNQEPDKQYQIATVSPADICYEETLSTLRYAERTKNIRNKAVINENPTERLILELRAENAKLRSTITKIRNTGLRVEEEMKELRQSLAENERQMAEIQTSWEEQLEKAQQEWEQKYKTLTQERRMIQMFPYLVNVNVDPQLSGFVHLFVQDGETVIGQSAGFPQAIVIKGFGVADKHAIITNLDNKVTLEPCGQAKVILNGALLLTKVPLKHLDRLILGSNSTYLYVGFPCERNGEDMSKYDYDFFQSELAAVEGFDRDALGLSNRNKKVDPSVLAVFLDYIRVKPLVAEANQISEELSKDLRFELEVKNLALTDSRGHDLVKEVIVKVTNKATHQVWVWSKAKFVNRKFIMEDIYQHFIDGKTISLDRESDPFWDPIDVVHLGTAYVWLQSLNYCIPLEEHVEFHNSQGEEEAVLQMNLVPCTPTGQPLSEDEILIDPTEMVGQRLDFQVQIKQCLGIRWLKQNSMRGIQIQYHVLNHPCPFCTKPIWNTVNARIDQVMQFTVKSVSEELLNYLQNHALVLDLWGLQEDCTEISSPSDDIELTDEGSIIIDCVRPQLPSSVEIDDDQLSELYIKLSKLEQEIELLRDVNRTLRKDNVSIKSTLRKMSDASRPDEKSFHRKNAEAFGSKGTPKASYEVDFAKALKTFYQSMNRVRNQLLGLRRHRPPGDDVETLRLYLDNQTRIIRDFGDSLELCMNTLKNDVSLIVKKKKGTTCGVLWQSEASFFKKQ